MSFRERVAWVFLTTTVLIFGPYFVHIGVLFAEDRLIGGEVLGTFIGATVVLTLLSILAGLALAFFRQEPKDERDTAIDLKAIRNAYYVFAGLTMTAILAVMCGTVLPTGPAWWAQPVLVGQVLLFSFVVAEVVHFATVVVCYRRGC